MTVALDDTGTVSFQQLAETFAATASQSTLSFVPVDLAVPGIGDLLDNVSLTGQTAPASSGAAQAIDTSAALLPRRVRVSTRHVGRRNSSRPQTDGTFLVRGGRALNNR